MLTELHIEALLVDGELADLVWEAWDRRLIDDESVIQAWVACEQSVFVSA